MKSFISEGKTVLDAISNALQMADYPTNFSVKIVEKETRSLLWWHNKKAVVVFSYTPKELQKSGTQKNYKKNYNKENVLYNNKFENNFDAPVFTSTMKIEKNQNTRNAQGGVPQKNRKNVNQSTLEKKRSNTFDSSNSHPAISQNNHYKEDKKETDNKIDFDKPQEQRQKRSDDNRIKRSSHHPLGNTNNGQNSSDLGSALNGKTIIEEKPMIKIEKELTNSAHVTEKNVLFKEWKEKHVSFVQKWITELNETLLFTNQAPLITIKENTLTIKILEYNSIENIVKKHFYSSIVILLYETLQNTFRDFSIKDFKIIME
jgi:hypothetical protein